MQVNKVRVRRWMQREKGEGKCFINCTINVKNKIEKKAVE